jgi:hypothetical protein
VTVGYSSFKDIFATMELMIDFFKQGKQAPFAYPSIEMRKTSGGYFKWIAVIIIFIAILFIFFFLK